MIRRILAFILAGLLIGMYVLTLVFGLMQNPRTTDLLMASVAATIIVPVILYAYQRIYRLIHSQEDNDGTGNAK
jgi:putative hydrolase of the HAD superfamily